MEKDGKMETLQRKQEFHTSWLSNKSRHTLLLYFIVKYNPLPLHGMAEDRDLTTLTKDINVLDRVDEIGYQQYRGTQIFYS